MMRLSEKPQVSVSYSKSHNRHNNAAPSLSPSYNNKACPENSSSANLTRHSHGSSPLYGYEQELQGSLGTAVEGVPEGEAAGVDDVLKKAALMVCQSRQPDVASAVGYSDGIHSPLNKQRAQHVCSETDSEVCYFYSFI